MTPRTLELSPEARALWIALHDAVEQSMGSDDVLAGLRDVAGKAAEQAARIAGVLQIVDDANANVIETDAMARACELADWYLREAARRAYEMAIPPAVRDAQTLLAWLHARGLETVTAAFVQKHGPGPLRAKARLDPTIETLEAHGWLVPDDSSRRAWRVARPLS